jgi:hypothetical protein
MQGRRKGRGRARVGVGEVSGQVELVMCERRPRPLRCDGHLHDALLEAKQRRAVHWAQAQVLEQHLGGEQRAARLPMRGKTQAGGECKLDANQVVG